MVSLGHNELIHPMGIYCEYLWEDLLQDIYTFTLELTKGTSYTDTEL